MEKQQAYLEMLLSKEENFETMEAYAKKHRVPIMDKTSMHFVRQLTLLQQPKYILEIGTAIGYSAIQLASALPDTHITTLERDEEMIRVATDNIAKWGLESRIKVISGEARESLLQLKEAEKTFDFIFIDAAKAQYQQLFKNAEPLLKMGGMIICDNVLFKGYVADPNRASSTRLKELATKIDHFNQWLSENKAYHTSFVPIGDGIAISQKKDMY